MITGKQNSLHFNSLCAAPSDVTFQQLSEVGFYARKEYNASIWGSSLSASQILMECLFCQSDSETMKALPITYFCELNFMIEK